jgi:hypothetical protein
MESGINILTNSEPVIVDGAVEAIQSYSEGKLTQQELYDKILNLDVVYVDRKKFKASEE